MTLENVTDEQADDEVEEVEIQEANEPVKDEQQEPVEETEEETSENKMLAEAEVEALLEDARLPDSVKELLRLREYADGADLEEAISGMVEAFKQATGSGKPAVTQGRGQNVDNARPATLAERDAAKSAVNSKWLGTRAREVKND